MTKEKKADLYLEQIKYIRDENNSIQDKFLSGVDVPLAALGILIFYIESEGNEPDNTARILYLLLPFLCISILYNLIKYSIRILINNGYLKHLEKQMNLIFDEKIFLMNKSLRDTSAFPLGFAIMTTFAQIPIYFAIGLFLLMRFGTVIKEIEISEAFCVCLIVCLVIEIVFIVMMSIDLILVQTKTLMKIDEILEDKDYLYKPEEEGIFKKWQKYWINKLEVRKNVNVAIEELERKYNEE